MPGRAIPLKQTSSDELLTVLFPFGDLLQATHQVPARLILH